MVGLWKRSLRKMVFPSSSTKGRSREIFFPRFCSRSILPLLFSGEDGIVWPNRIDEWMRRMKKNDGKIFENTEPCPLVNPMRWA